MRTSDITSERGGFALPATLLAMFVIGAIVTGGFYVSGQEHNVSVSTDLGAQALHAAEYGLEESLPGITTGDVETLAIGEAHQLATGSVWDGFTATASEVGTYVVHAMPLGDRLYLLQSQGEVVRGNHVARRRVAMLVRADRINLPYAAAMTVYGKLDAGGNSQIAGEDECTADVVTGVVAADTSLVSGGDKTKNEKRITGDPEVEGDSTLLATVDDHLDIPALIAGHNKKVSGSKSIAPSIQEDAAGNQFCDYDDPDNFGAPDDPTHPCHDYYPVIYSDGNLQLNTGSGQGVLVVDGDLELAGHVNFYGVVIVTGSLKIAGTGKGTGKISGTVIALGDSQIETESTTIGDAQVRYDSCSIDNALSNLPVRPFADRAWITDMPTIAP